MSLILHELLRGDEDSTQHRLLREAWRFPKRSASPKVSYSIEQLVINRIKLADTYGLIYPLHP